MNITTLDHWFYCYKGFVYANKPTTIHDRINNKAMIDAACKVNPNRTVINTIRHGIRKITR